MKKYWYEIKSLSHQTSNVATIVLNDGTTIRVWIHPDQDHNDRVCEVSISSKKLFHRTKIGQYRKPK